MLSTLVLVAVMLAVAVCLALQTPALHVYAISLRRHQHRRSKMKARVPSVEFVNAVDGRTLKYGIGSLSRRELGCFYSHVKAWKRVAGSKQPYALVLEDDADVKMPQAWSRIRTMVTACPADWDILFLGLNNPPNNAQCVARGRCSVRKLNGDTQGLHAVALSREGARKLLRAWDKYRIRDPAGNTCPVDVWVSRLPGINGYWVDPPLIAQSR